MRGRDVIASISIAGIVLPEAVAYAAIAGLPAEPAIIASIVGALAYAAVGRSRFAVISPTSSSAAILGASLSLITTNADLRLALATVVTALVGILFLAAGVFRLGGLANFISRPVLRGFAFGLSVTIILKQLPVLVGLSVNEPDIFRLTFAVVAGIGSWHPASLITGLLALAALFAFKRAPALPGMFVVLAAGILASLAFDLPARGVKVLGDVDLALSWPSLPDIASPELIVLAELVVPLVLVLFAESWGTMRAMALRHGDAVEPDRELQALGAANIAATLVQGMPVGAGFSAGAASEAAGASSRAAGAIAAILLLALMLLAGSLVAHLPQPVVAAVVVASLMHSLHPAPLVRLWRLKRDAYIGLGAAAGVLVLGILNGMLFAIVLSIAALVRRMAATRVARLGRLDGGHDYVDVVRHPEAVAPPGIAIWRPAEPLFFANAEPILARIAAAQAAEPSTRHLIVSLERTFELDSTALDALTEFDTLMRSRGIEVRLARVRDEVRDVLVSGGATGLAERCSYSVDDAVEASAAK